MNLVRVLTRVLLVMFSMVDLLVVGTTAAEPFFNTQDVFVRKTEGYHTFRLPCIVASETGTVLLFADGRVNGAGDLGKINLVLKRSLDGGNTWEALQVLAKEGGTKIGNASAVYDRQHNAVHVIYCCDLVQAFCLTTHNDGQTFRPPLKITETFHRFPPTWKFFATGHVHGIQMNSGRLAIPIFLSEVPRTGGGRLDRFHVGLITSDDGGANWEAGGLVPEGRLLNEHSVFQLADDSLVINARATGVGHRMVASSRDGGQTWSPPQGEPALYDSTCQASTLVVSDPQGRRFVLLSNPAGPGRKNLTVRISQDEGKTWPLAVRIDANAAAYSDLASGPNGTIYLAYETGQHGAYEKIALARFNLRWLLKHATSTP